MRHSPGVAERGEVQGGSPGFLPGGSQAKMPAVQRPRRRKGLTSCPSSKWLESQH